MKMDDAIKAMNPSPLDTGFMVHFERRSNGLLVGDWFPDKHAGEPLIITKSEAWEMAVKFASKQWGEVVNVYVIDAYFRPVPEYRERMIINR